MAPSLSSFKKLYLEEQFSTLWPEELNVYSLNLGATAKIKSCIWLCYPREIKMIIIIIIIIKSYTHIHTHKIK